MVFWYLGIKKVIILFVPYLCHGKEVLPSFPSPPPFKSGYLKTIGNKREQIQYSLVALLDPILCLCISFVSMSILTNISNAHAPTLEHTNLSRLDFDKWSSTWS